MHMLNARAEFLHGVAVLTDGVLQRLEERAQLGRHHTHLQAHDNEGAADGVRARARTSAVGRESLLAKDSRRAQYRTLRTRSLLRRKQAIKVLGR